MQHEKNLYDAVIVGGGHNGLIAACYLARAGRSVLILEKNGHVGGATDSQVIFPGVDARVSVYSYLISLLPKQILDDLDIALELPRRAIASYSPVQTTGGYGGLLISNVADGVTQESFRRLTGGDDEYRRYQQLDEMISLFARKVWPTLLGPLPAKEALRQQFHTPEERKAWEYIVEKPLSCLIEDHLKDDTTRGAVFTDAKIGVLTYPEDPTLLQNRTFIYHTIGQGTGEWRVPVGGIGALVRALEARARGLGVTIHVAAEVTRVDHGAAKSAVHYLQDGKPAAVDARWVLFNTSSDIANRCLPGVYAEEQVEGSVFKINMVLRRLPVMKDPHVTARDAFTGTLHFNEGYENMKVSYQNAQAGIRMESLPGEVYCHSLTDPSILSPALREQGYHTLTLFGLDVPYHWFSEDPERVKAEITQTYLNALQAFLADNLADCLAVDASGNPCVEAKSPLDLERSLGLPRGNIFHGSLTWPFAANDEVAGTWGVETRYANVLICGSSAKRGGAVSGIPGHHAAMKVLE